MKRLLFVLLLISCSTSLYSQEFYGGLLAGFNGSKVNGDRAFGYNKMGLIGGAWVQRNTSDNFYWGMELKVNQKGSRIFPTIRNGNWKYVLRLNYVDLPVWVGYQHKPYLSFFTGLSYGYLFNKHGYDSFGKSPVDDYKITNWELGMFAGLRVDFQRLVERDWAQKFILETRFQYSILSIDTAHDFFTYYLSTGQYNNVISTVLYYRMDWGGVFN